MRLREHTKLEIKVILVIVLFSGMIGGLYTGLFRYNKPIDIVHGILVAIGISLSIASSHAFFLRAWMKRRSFSVAALSNTAFILLAILAILIISSAAFDKGGWTALNLREVIGSATGFDTILFSLLISFIFSFLIQINRLIGGRVFFSFFTGKYHRPVEEDRIFMSLDLNSSTAIAEKIGHINFHRFINDFFFAISEAIIANGGEIYKYVGDEAIITWNMRQGLKDLRCIRLFFDAQERVGQKKALFEKKYGVVPEFKAGLHCGKVVSGEMGDTKKEIAFLGDVINTTARIEKECNLHQRALLISIDLLEKLNLGKGYRYEKIGDIPLRGKSGKVALYAIDRSSARETAIGHDHPENIRGSESTGVGSMPGAGREIHEKNIICNLSGVADSLCAIPGRGRVLQ